METLPRALEGWAREVLDVSPVLVIEGARQVGKSTLARLLAGDESVLTTMDDDLTRTFAHDDPVGFLRSGGGRRLVVDEVQRCPELILPLKAEVDRDRRPGRFVMTGSANLLRLPNAEDSLAGRAMTIRLHPFARAEIAQGAVDWVTHIVASDLPLAVTSERADIVGCVASGGYPLVQGLTSRMRGAWLRDYTNRLIERDATDIAPAQVGALRHLLNAFAAAPMGELVFERLAHEMGLARVTVQRHLEILESLFLVERLPSWSRNLSNRQIKRPKVMLTDSGLAASLCAVSEAHLASPAGSDHFGPLLENFVVCELRRQQGWSTTEFSLYHYRDRLGSEVDVIIETPQGIVGVEVKATTVARPEHFKHLVGLRDRLGAEFLAGIVLTTGSGGRAGDRLSSMSVASLWESTA